MVLLNAKCPKCGNTEWIRFSELPEYESYPISFRYKYVRCIRCGFDAVLYKCPICDDYTPHVWVRYKGEAKKHATDIPYVGYLEEYKCLVCGHTKTIRKGGSFARM